MAIPREPVVEMQRRFGRPGTRVLDRLRQARLASGQLTPESIDAVAAELGLPRAHVYGAATFFEEIGLRRRGERHVQVCAGTACFAASGGRHVPAVERQLGLSRGECLPDGSLSLQPVYCLGYCYGGPAALDNEQACVGPDLVDQLPGGRRAPRPRDPGLQRRRPSRAARGRAARRAVLAGVAGRRAGARRGRGHRPRWPRRGCEVAGERASPRRTSGAAAAAPPTPGPRYIVATATRAIRAPTSTGC